MKTRLKFHLHSSRTSDLTFELKLPSYLSSAIFFKDECKLKFDPPFGGTSYEAPLSESI